MELIKKLIQAISSPMGWVYYYLLILSLISNYIVLTYDEGLLAVLSILGFSVVTAYVEALVYKVLPVKVLQTAFLCVVAVIHNAVCITDYFILINFQRIINQGIIDILGETNPDEISNFAASYLQFHKILMYIITAVLINYAAVKVSKYIVRLKSLRILNIAILLWGCAISVYTCVNFALYRNGMSMPQRTALTRLGYSYYIMKQRSNSVERVHNLCRSIKVVSTPPRINICCYNR